MQSVLHPIMGPKKEIHDLLGRVSVVNGGAFGIGHEISRPLVVNVARVIMINRKEEQGQEAIDAIQMEAGEHAKIEWVPYDLGHLKEVKEVSSGTRKREHRLDLVCQTTEMIAGNAETTFSSSYPLE